MLHYAKSLLLLARSNLVDVLDIEWIKKAKVGIMAAAPVPVTAGGIWAIVEAMSKTGTVVLGFLTALLGCVTAGFILRYWVKKSNRADRGK